MPQPYLSIIIPAHNEEKRLPACLDRWIDYLWSQSYEYEIIIVPNGCTDGTLAICEKYRSNDHEHVRFLPVALRGKGYAVRAGMLAAHGRYRYMADVDLSTPPDEVARFIDRARDGWPVVIGSRTVQPKTTTITFKRAFIGAVFHGLIRTVLPELYVMDTQCGFKLFRHDAAEGIFRKLRLSGMAFDVEVLYLAFRLKYPIYELGVQWTHDKDSRVRLWHDSTEMLRDLLRIKRLHRRVLVPRRAAPSPEEVPAD